MVLGGNPATLSQLPRIANRLIARTTKSVCRTGQARLPRQGVAQAHTLTDVPPHLLPERRLNARSQQPEQDCTLLQGRQPAGTAGRPWPPQLGSWTGQEGSANASGPHDPSIGVTIPDGQTPRALGGLKAKASCEGAF